MQPVSTGQPKWNYQTHPEHAWQTAPAHGALSASARNILHEQQTADTPVEVRLARKRTGQLTNERLVRLFHDVFLQVRGVLELRGEHLLHRLLFQDPPVVSRQADEHLDVVRRVGEEALAAHVVPLRIAVHEGGGGHFPVLGLRAHEHLHHIRGHGRVGAGVESGLLDPHGAEDVLGHVLAQAHAAETLDDDTGEVNALAVVEALARLVDQGPVVLLGLRVVS